MVDTVVVTLVANTWVELPTAAEFTFTNNMDIDVYVLASALTPTAADIPIAHILRPKLSTNGLTTGKHWVLCAYAGKCAYTSDDR